MATIAENAARVLEYLVEHHGEDVEPRVLAASLAISPEDLNDAVTILEENGFVDWVRWLGTHPFEFGSVSSTPRGKYEYERLRTVQDAQGAASLSGSATTLASGAIRRPPTPIGSPYGFHEEDWEIVADRHADQGVLYVVLGHEWNSRHFDTSLLRQNVHEMFERAVTVYNAGRGAIPTVLTFVPLAAGYGEHLFNEIARDIIAADIAVFETSDLNPNVMLEMGVALTWGVRVLAIKKEGCPKPPSDVSGQTWADYFDSAARFTDPEHERKLARMVDRAIRKKGHA